MHLAAESLDRIGVAKLVDELGDGKGGVEQEQIAGREHRLGLVEGAVPVTEDHRQRGDEQPHPNQHGRAGGDPAQERPRLGEEPVGIEQAQAQIKDAEQLRGELLAAALLMAGKKPGGIGRRVAHQKIGAVELGEQRDHLTLAGSGIRGAAHTIRPHLVHRARAIEPGHKIVGLLAEAEKLIGEAVLGDVPTLAAKSLAADRHRGPQAELLAGHTVPGFGKYRALRLAHASKKGEGG